MATKYTNGPWLGCHMPAGFLRVSARNGATICDIGRWHTEHYDEMMSNCYLIASAPELLEALIPFAYFSGDLRDEADRDRLNDMFAAARRAVALAIGKPATLTDAFNDIRKDLAEIMDAP